MTIEAMATELKMDPDNLRMWLKSVGVFVNDGLTVEQSVARIHRLFSYLAQQIALPAEQRTPEFNAWFRRMADDVYHTIRARSKNPATRSGE